MSVKKILVTTGSALAITAALSLTGCATNGGAPGLNCAKPIVHHSCKGMNSCKGTHMGKMRRRRG